MKQIALFALTGFGNAVLRALIDAGYKPAVIVTRNDRFPFPYYEELDLPSEALQAGVPVYFGAEGEAIVELMHPEVILVATYDRILKKRIFAGSTHAVNLHPALLPSYRGASPFYWVIRNHESETGITAHYLTEEVDTGDLLFQQHMPISAQETQGSLRKKLAFLAGKIAVRVLKELFLGTLYPQPQDSSLASTYPRVDDAIRVIQPGWDHKLIESHLRALSPFPKAIWNGQEVTIEHLEQVCSSMFRT